MINIEKNKNNVNKKDSNNINSEIKSLLVVYAKSSADDTRKPSDDKGFAFNENKKDTKKNIDNWLSRASARAERYKLQRQAQKILYSHSAQMVGKDPEKRTKYHRTITCMRSMVLNDVRVQRQHRKAFYGGLNTCGNVWVCPVCASKIQTKRTKEVQKLYRYAYQEKKQVIMVTLTFPHKINDKLENVLKLHSKALEIFRKYNNTNFKNFRNEIGYMGLVRGLEITHGQNGWHPHTHELWIVDSWQPNPEKEEKIRDYILNRWKHACMKVGLLKANKITDFQKYAVDIIFRTTSSDYIAKQTWCTASEVACSCSKKAKNSGDTPFQMLQKSETSGRYRSLFIEYTKAMKGKAQLFWTPGLKNKVGIKEKTDQQLAIETSEKADLLALLSREHWICVVKNSARAEILEIAEKQGTQGLIDWFKQYNLILNKPTDEQIETEQKQYNNKNKQKHTYKR